MGIGGVRAGGGPAGSGQVRGRWGQGRWGVSGVRAGEGSAGLAQVRTLGSVVSSGLAPLEQGRGGGSGAREPEAPKGLRSLAPPPSLQVMSIEEVERVLDETQEAVEYQRVGARVRARARVRGARLPPPTRPGDSCQLGDCPGAPLGSRRPCLWWPLFLARGLSRGCPPRAASPPGQPPLHLGPSSCSK